MNYLKNLKYFTICLLAFGCSKPVEILNGNLLVEINDQLETRVNHTGYAERPLIHQFSASEYLVCKKFDAKYFSRESVSTEPISDKKGKGERKILTGSYNENDYDIQKIVEISVYDSFPDMAFFQIQYVNKGPRDIEVVKWVNNSYPVRNTTDSPPFWSFQGSSTQQRKDWILPVDSSFSQKNYMGMNNTDYGGGIPVVDLWRKDVGIAIGHTDLVPRAVSLPVEKDKYDPWVNISVEYQFDTPFTFRQGDTLKTYSTFVSVHRGDCFSSLKAYSKFMHASGIEMAPIEPEAYGAVWCAWGYERQFTVKEVIATLPKVKELGIKWIDIDDGFQQAEGDWDVDPAKFPGGNADMRKMVDQIHDMGLKVKLWWAPLAVDPNSKLLRQNPDILLRNRDGVPQFISYWDSYYMSPGYSKTINHTKSVLELFLKDWDYDGLKMDGGFLNAVPPDYNPACSLQYPEQASENLPQFFQMVEQTAKTFKPNAVLQICPCGAAMSFFTMPYTNQTVASDPTSSWQIRMKGKTYKALLGKTAYYGDHVELSDGGDDFASQIGIGAVLGTKFTWPKDNPYVQGGKSLLTPEKEKIWKKWFGIYNSKMIPTGDYLGELYDIGFDKPEAHAIQKGDTLYYAFYDKNWKGKVELRGLGTNSYNVKDYANDIDYGIVDRRSAQIDVQFEGALLLEAIPVNP